MYSILRSSTDQLYSFFNPYILKKKKQKINAIEIEQVFSYLKESVISLAVFDASL